MFWETSWAKPQKAGTALDSQGSVERSESKFQVFEGIFGSENQRLVIGWSKERRRRVRTPVARLLLRLLLRRLQQGGYWTDLLRTLLSQPLGGGPGRCGRMHGALLQLGWFSFAMLRWKGVTLKLQNLYCVLIFVFSPKKIKDIIVSKVGCPKAANKRTFE